MMKNVIPLVQEAASPKRDTCCLSSYLDIAIVPEKRKDIISKLARKINSSKLEFDTIAFTGVSGALIGPALADKLNKKMIIVRKKETKTHAYRKAEGFYKFSTSHKEVKYIIIDDVIDSGKTIVTIIQRIDKVSMLGKTNGLKNNCCVGIFLYNDSTKEHRERNSYCEVKEETKKDYSMDCHFYFDKRRKTSNITVPVFFIRPYPIQS